MSGSNISSNSLRIYNFTIFTLSRMKVAIPLITCFSMFLISCGVQPVSSNKPIAIIETNKGIIKIELKDEEAPVTTANFKKLAEQKFYNGLTFHRVEPGFVVQGGDPLGNGRGGSEEKIKLEIPCSDGKTYLGEIAPKSCVPVLPHTKGAVAMARSNDPNSASSQFYITLDDASFLNGAYAVFGYVIEGMDVVQKIQVGDVIKSITTNDT